MALTLLNADPKKLIVAVGQAYLAYQARRQEVVDMISLSSRPDHLKQEVLDILLYTYALKLPKAAQESWVVEPGDFAIFFNHGYIGLFE